MGLACEARDDSHESMGGYNNKSNILAVSRTAPVKSCLNPSFRARHQLPQKIAAAEFLEKSQRLRIPYSSTLCRTVTNARNPEQYRIPPFEKFPKAAEFSKRNRHNKRLSKHTRSRCKLDGSISDLSTMIASLQHHHHRRRWRNLAHESQQFHEILSEVRRAP